MKNNKEKYISLKRNFSWTFISNVIYSVSQWGVLIIIARLGNAEMVGQFTLGLAFISPIIAFTTLKTETIYITDQQNEYNFSDYFSVRLLTSCISVCILLVLLLVVDNSTETVIIILLVSLYKITESVSQMVYATMQKQEVVKFIAVSKSIKGLLMLIIITFSLYSLNSIILGLFLINVLYLLMFLLFDLKNALNFSIVKVQYIPQRFLQIIKIALPLGFLYMLTSLNTNIPRYFVESFFDTEILGYFSAISYMVVNNVNVFTNALNNIIIPRFSMLISSNELFKIKKLLRNLELLGLSLGIFSITLVFVFGDLLLNIVYGHDYIPYTNIFKILIFSSLFLFISSFHNCLIFSARYFRIQPILGLIWIFSSIILGFILIPHFGLEGVAYSVVLVSIIQFISRFILLKVVIRKLEIYSQT